MRKRFVSAFVFLVSLIFIASCDGGDSQENNNNENSTPVVYLSGGSSSTNTYYSIYSKDGVITTLSPDTIAIGTSLFATDSQVYVSGLCRETGVIDIPCYWNGTTKVNLTFAGPDEGYTTGIYVSGSDVYVSGYYPESGEGHFDFKACYWKNGTVHLLDDGFVATSIYVSGSDVYVSGADSSLKPVCWKNGVKVALSTSAGIAYELKVVSSDVYVVGVVNQGGDAIAVYWKNGIVTELSSAGSDALGTSIFVNGTDVYVVGLYQDYTKLAYWKNDSSDKVDLDTGSYLPTEPGLEFKTWRLPKIALSSGDVYVVAPLGDGTYIQVGGYWKNGVLSTPTEKIYTNVFIK